MAPDRSRFTAKFLDAELEREFAKDSFQKATGQFVRFSVPLATVAFLAYGLHDWLVLPEYLSAWKIRYAVFGPIAAVTLIGLRAPGGHRFLQPLALAFGYAAALVVIWIGALVPVHGFIYTGYATLFVIMGPFLLRMSVVTELIFTLLTVATYLAFDVLVGHSAPEVRASVAATLVTMGAIGALAAWQLETQSREGFLQRRTIDEEKGRSEALLLNVLPAKIAERLKSEKRAIADGFAEVSVLFADIVGFTKMGERVAPAELVERLNQVFSVFDDLADKLRLEKIKTIGDAYMVAGGLNLERHDHAEGIVEMALAMQRRMADLGRGFGEELSLRIGIHTGPAVAGVIGKKKFIYDVWGDTVNTASRMESHGEPGRIHVTQAVYERLQSKFEFVDRGEIEVKGKGRMHTYYLLGRKGGVSSTRLPWEL